MRQGRHQVYNPTIQSFQLPSALSVDPTELTIHPFYSYLVASDRVVKGECLSGEQVVHYLAPKTCIVPDGAETSSKMPCKTRIPFVLQVAIGASVTTALTLCLIVAYCWKRNRRLEFKYMKLARHKTPARTASSGGNSGADDDKELRDSECETEMTAAESCALDDGEDEEEVSITVPIKSYGLINKIRSMTTAKVLRDEGKGADIFFFSITGLNDIDCTFTERIWKSIRNDPVDRGKILKLTNEQLR